MDCNMPFMDGYEASIQIRQAYQDANISLEKQPKIIAITGHIEKEYIQKALNSGMNRVLSKPL